MGSGLVTIKLGHNTEQSNNANIFFSLVGFFLPVGFFTSNLCLESGKKNRGGLYKKSFHKKLNYGNCSKSIKNVVAL